MRLQFLDLPGSMNIHIHLHFNEIDPMGITNYGKLTNISIVPTASPAAKVGAAGTGLCWKWTKLPTNIRVHCYSIKQQASFAMKIFFSVSFVVAT